MNAVRHLLLVSSIIGMVLSGARVAAELFGLIGDEYMAWAKQSSGQTRQDFWLSGVAFYRNASRVEPWQSQHKYKLGQAYVTSAEESPPFTDEARSAWSHAAHALGQAVSWDPANGRLHAAFAWAALH